MAYKIELLKIVIEILKNENEKLTVKNVSDVYLRLIHVIGYAP